jgi:hypothetical protein
MVGIYTTQYQILINKSSYMSKIISILGREAYTISDLLANGLGSMRKINRQEGIYYNSFYNLSIGLERLAKLIIYLKNPSLNIKDFGHDLVKLNSKLGIIFEDETINSILRFLNTFAKGNRYCIIDYLGSKVDAKLKEEPIFDFYHSIVKKHIIQNHPFKRERKYLTNEEIIKLDIFNLNQPLYWSMSNIQILDIDFQNRFLMPYNWQLDPKFIDHVSKYFVMYFGRLLQPYFELLSTFDGRNFEGSNWFPSEFFWNLMQGDQHFKTRKTFILHT